MAYTAYGDYKDEGITINDSIQLEIYNYQHTRHQMIILILPVILSVYLYLQ